MGRGLVLLLRFQGDSAAEDWVQDRALAILDGQAVQVAAGIRRRATTQKLSKAKRRKADLCAGYLTNKAPLGRKTEASRHECGSSRRLQRRYRYMADPRRLGPHRRQRPGP